MTRGRKPTHDADILLALVAGPQTCPEIAAKVGMLPQNALKRLEVLVERGKAQVAGIRPRSGRVRAAQLFALPGYADTVEAFEARGGAVERLPSCGYVPAPCMPVGWRS